MVVNITIVGRKELGIFFFEEASKDLHGEHIAGPQTGFGIILGQRRALVDPFPEDAQTNLPGRHIFHQIENVIVAEKVGGLQGCSLKTLAEGVTILQGDAQQVTCPANGTWCRFQQRQSGGIFCGVG